MTERVKADGELSRETILRAFAQMSQELERRGTTGEICRFGGAVMVLAFASRISTNDVDAILHVMDIVAAYYPPQAIPVKAQYLVEGLFEEGKT